MLTGVLARARQWTTLHWDTCLLLVSGCVFLWQVALLFLPSTGELPPLPESTSPPPAVFVSHGDDAAPLEALPEAEVKSLLQSGSARHATAKRYPPKKPKPQLKPGSIHLNSVTLSQLDLLPGVGPKLAQRIIDYRKEHGPFQSVEDLKKVKGIGEKNFAKMSIYLAL